MSGISDFEDAAVSRWSLAAPDGRRAAAAVARVPGGALNVLLAQDSDGSGKLPRLLAAFRRMSGKGFGIAAIARELNGEVRRGSAPAQVAATLVSVDFHEGYVSIWNGGNPEPLLQGPGGQPVCRFAVAQPPLGAVDDAGFVGRPEVHSFGAGADLFLCNLAVVAEIDGGGQGLVGAGLAQAAAGAPTARRLEALTARIEASLGDRPPSDDLMVLGIECRRRQQHLQPRESARPGAASAACLWQTRMCLTAPMVRRVDVVPVLMDMARQFVGTRPCFDSLFVVLSEIYNNALDHGLLRLDSRLKLHPEGMEAYLVERQRRLDALATGDIDLSLAMIADGGGQWLRVVCRDSGPGFDHAAITLARQAAAERGTVPFGRGLMLLRGLCSDLTFNDIGNEVIATMPVGGGEPLD